MKHAGLASRILAAIVGGYGLSALASVFVAMCLPMSRAEAVQTGMLISIPVLIGVCIWAFAASSATRVWLWLAGSAATMAAITAALHFGKFV